MLGDRRVDHPLVAELLEQALADLVGALVLGRPPRRSGRRRVAPHLLGHGVAQRLAHGHRDELGARPAHRASAAGAAAAAHASGWQRGSAASAAARAAGVLWPVAWRERRSLRRYGAAGSVRSRRRPAITAIGVLTLTPSVPSGTRILRQLAFVDGLDLHGRLVGLDLGDDVAGLDIVAVLLRAIWRACPPPWSATARASGSGRHGLSRASRRLSPIHVGPELGRIRLGIGWANSAASSIRWRDLGVDASSIRPRSQPLLQEPRASPARSDRARSRIFWTSSLERYLAGSDIEWPR